MTQRLRCFVNKIQISNNGSHSHV